MLKKLAKLMLLAAVVAAAVSCSSKTYKNINYFQDVEDQDATMRMAVSEGIVIQPQDKVAIYVSSPEPALAAQFNQMRISMNTQGGETENVGNGNNLLGYVVDSHGEISFPVLGTLKVAGMSRWRLASYVENELRNRGLLKEPTVTVEFMNFKISVLGEVGSPGSYQVVGDKVTLLQALSMAGDLTIHGKRDNVTVMREQDDVRTFYHVDLRSTDFFDSPAYYLKQSDVVYVYPDKVRAGQSTINDNNMRSIGFWTSIPSLMLSLTTTTLFFIERFGKNNKD